jgi:hypothetical protein
MMTPYEKAGMQQFLSATAILLLALPPCAQQGAPAFLAHSWHDMSKSSNYIAASFPLLRYATGAVDWFRNQAIDPSAIVIAAVPPDGRPRAPQRGDNERMDLTWIVALDLNAARIPRAVAQATLVREGGKKISNLSDLQLPAERS